MTGSKDFQAYALNLTRLAVMGLIEDMTFKQRNRNARASLVVNPITNRPYYPDNFDCDETSGPGEAHLAAE